MKNKHGVDISKIQVGDFIDCTGYHCLADDPQVHIQVVEIDKLDSQVPIAATQNSRWIEFNQITKHYPQASETKYDSIGNKPAKDKTLLEEFVLEAMKALIVSKAEFSDITQSAQRALTIAQAHIKQLDDIKG